MDEDTVNISQFANYFILEFRNIHCKPKLTTLLLLSKPD